MMFDMGVINFSRIKIAATLPSSPTETDTSLPAHKLL